MVEGGRREIIMNMDNYQEYRVETSGSDQNKCVVSEYDHTYWGRVVVSNTKTKNIF